MENMYEQKWDREWEIGGEWSTNNVKRDWKTRTVKGNGKQGCGEEMKSPGRGNGSVRAMNGREMHGGKGIRKPCETMSKGDEKRLKGGMGR